MHQRYVTSSSMFHNGREEDIRHRMHLLYYFLREGLMGHARVIFKDQTSRRETEPCYMEFLFWKGKRFFLGS